MSQESVLAIREDLISIEVWEAWLSKLVQFITSFDGKIDVVGMLGQLKMKVEDCSFSYTGMWTLDTLHEAWAKNSKKLGAEFKKGLDELQTEWNGIMGGIREQRRELLGKKCVEYLVNNFKDWQKIISQHMLEALLAKNSLGDVWAIISKQAKDDGWMDNADYKKFLSKLMIEMTKY